MYFVTICSFRKEHLFGEIRNDAMVLNEIGEIVEQEWIRTPSLRPDMNLELDAFVVMPNHFHGIVAIGRNRYNDWRTDSKSDKGTQVSRDGMHSVSTNSVQVLQTQSATNSGHVIPLISTNTGQAIGSEHKGHLPNTFGVQSKTLGSIVRGFKSSVTVRSRKVAGYFKWQDRFHDHIIRDNEEYFKIRNYIISNPKNWLSDKFFANVEAKSNTN